MRYKPYVFFPNTHIHNNKNQKVEFLLFLYTYNTRINRFSKERMGKALFDQKKEKKNHT